MNIHVKDYRPDIDGLRAIAVTLVILFHAVPTLASGGFIGVDVFFVISGFLITSIIGKELRQNTFTFRRFYEKRILRIFPALVCVLVFCLLFGYATLLSRDYKLLGKHVAAGATYVSNFVLLNEAGYFDGESEMKSLLHLWSLAIEEQFYLVWPIVVAITIRKKKNPLLVVGAATLLSFILCLGYTQRLPDVVFYTPLTRCWELFIGAMLAFLPRTSRPAVETPFSAGTNLPMENPPPGHMNHLFSFAGLLLIAYAAATFKATDRFPYWRAIVPCIGTALVIAAGAKAFANKVLLGSRVAVYIGLISYPLYLWHWPALFFARLLSNHQLDYFYIAIAIAISLLAAILTYHGVEKRVRLSRSAHLPMALFTLLLLVGGAGFLIFQSNGFPDRYPELESRARNSGSYAWNEQGFNYSPACVKLLDSKFAQYCNIMDASKPPTIVLLGDSTANHFYHGLSSDMLRTHSAENLLQIGKGGCPPLLDVEASRDTGKQDCGKTMQDALDYIHSTPSVRTLVLTMTGASYINETRVAVANKADYFRLLSLSRPNMESPTGIMEAGLRQTLLELQRSGKDVIFLLSAPVLRSNPADCMDLQPHSTKGPKNASCDVDAVETSALNSPYRELIGNVLKDFPNVKIWDPYSLVCNGATCRPVQDGLPLYRDGIHLSIHGSELIGRKLLEANTF